MAYTTDMNLINLPAGAVDWLSGFNDAMQKIEKGFTIAKIAAATINQYQCFYINSAGKAAIASASTDVAGIWDTTTTATDVLGYGRVLGTQTNGAWTWTPGVYLYSGASGALTATPSTTGRRIAYALTATKILLISNFMTTYTASKALVTDASGNVVASAATAAELAYVIGGTSAFQGQIDAKKTIATGSNYKWETTGAGGALQETTVTASRAVATDANGLPVAATTTAAELEFVNGVTSALQPQVDAKAPKANPAFTGDVSVEKTIVTPGTTGAQTINKTAGRVNFALGATTLVVTNSLATANSIILATAATSDVTGYVLNTVAAAGSFTITVVAPAAEMAVNWIVIN